MHARIRTSHLTAVLCSLAVIRPALAQEQAPPAASQAAPAEEPPALTAEQLDALVAPIALYPDPLLAQVLAASTYPLEIVQLQQWLGQHADLKDQALADAVDKQDWDPSVQSLAALPDVVKLLTKDIKWTDDLGNAFLAQQSGVMEAVQRMRAKAKKNGTLASNEHMSVETKTVDKETIVVIEPANPQVIYVPTYNPAVVYAPAPPTGAYVAGAMISFGVGVAVGAAFRGGWGYNCGWGGSHNNVVNINTNNRYVRNSSVRAGGQPGVNRGQWQHNPQHRGGAPYRNQTTANRYGGSASRETARAAAPRAQSAERAAKQAPDRQGRDLTPAADRGDRAGASAGADRVGNRADRPSGAERSRGGEGLSGGSRQSFSGSEARSNSARGSSSMGSRGGGMGGGRAGGGGRGGGRR